MKLIIIDMHIYRARLLRTTVGIEQRPDAKAGQTDEVVRTRDDYRHVYHFFPTARALGWWCPRFER